MSTQPQTSTTVANTAATTETTTTTTTTVPTNPSVQGRPWNTKLIDANSNSTFMSILERPWSIRRDDCDPSPVTHTRVTSTERPWIKKSEESTTSIKSD